MNFKQIFVIGLRRSGTTVFWQSLRADHRFQCFDEPFNPKLQLLPYNHPKGTWCEFNSIYEQNPHEFRTRFAPITSEDEVSRELSRRQRSYLEWLCQQNPLTICDFTRCQFKIAALASMFPNALMVHLVRSPVAVATSHLLPSERKGYLSELKHWIRKLVFFNRRKGFNGWQFEEVINRVRNSELVLRDPRIVDLLSERQPAYVKLIGYWKLVSDFVEEEGRAAFDARFLTIEYEAFTNSPSTELARVYQFLGREAPSQDFTGIHAAKNGFRPEDPRWRMPLQLIASRKHSFRF